MVKAKRGPKSPKMAYPKGVNEELPLFYYQMANYGTDGIYLNKAAAVKLGFGNYTKPRFIWQEFKPTKELGINLIDNGLKGAKTKYHGSGLRKCEILAEALSLERIKTHLESCTDVKAWKQMNFFQIRDLGPKENYFKLNLLYQCDVQDKDKESLEEQNKPKPPRAEKVYELDDFFNDLPKGAVFAGVKEEPDRLEHYQFVAVPSQHLFLFYSNFLEKTEANKGAQVNILRNNDGTPSSQINEDNKGNELNLELVILFGKIHIVNSVLIRSKNKVKGEWVAVSKPLMRSMAEKFKEIREASKISGQRVIVSLEHYTESKHKVPKTSRNIEKPNARMVCYPIRNAFIDKEQQE